MTNIINNKIPETKIPEVTKESFNLLRTAYGNTTISNFIEYLRTVTGLKFEDIDYQLDWTPQFVSYLIDVQKRYMNGENIDLAVLHQDVINVFHPSKIEKQVLVKNNFEERLWAIFLAVSNPSLTKFNL